MHDREAEGFDQDGIEDLEPMPEPPPDNYIPPDELDFRNMVWFDSAAEFDELVMVWLAIFSWSGIPAGVCLHRRQLPANYSPIAH